jgi:hypothetical protein
MQTLKTILKFLNDNHWTIIGISAICGLLLWIYGCQSTVPSMLNPSKRVTRAELKLESDFLLGQVQVKLADLDNQDALKQLILDQAALFGQTGTFNPMGLLNTAISIGAISWGLNRNQKVNALTKAATAADCGGLQKNTA